MPEKRSESVEPPSPRRRRYKHRELALADGDKLVLAADGSISRIAPDGTTRQALAPDDLEWPGQAIRFGIRAQATTPNPHDRIVRQEHLPRR
jgi:hypothetical protein